jgi:hypothetical protein
MPVSSVQYFILGLLLIAASFRTGVHTATEVIVALDS